MPSKRSRGFNELPAIRMIGEGIIEALRPKRDLRLWRFGPQPWPKCDCRREI
ncbi:MAG TPA: hypothetical protein VJ302_27825 [Blastocatellia bacterium]|nr:hypothetical protein [Blastocatellia bacterium]